MVEEEKPVRKRAPAKARRLTDVTDTEPLSVPEWFDEVPPPWQQAWSEDDTPVGCQLAREMAVAAGKAG